MKISSGIRDYTVTISDKLPTTQIYIDEMTFVIIDRKVYDLYKENVFAGIPEERLALIDALEDKKTIDTALELCEKLTEIPAKRNMTLISFGGGITQDVTGFVANILYRGIHWVFYPTTLLAACDSCIGGKTSLNYKHYKNLLGTFFPPEEIRICTPFFDTLSDKDYESGLGEVVKFNILFGEEGIRRIERDIDRLLARDKTTLVSYVEKSLEFKKRYIEEDEYDRGIRIHLNYAHTFGHAFETVSNYAIPHGTAVAMGSITANRISEKRGWLPSETVRRMEKILCSIIHIKNYTDISLKDNNPAIISAIRKDKKQTDESIKAVLLNSDMKLEIVSDVTVDEIEEAVRYLNTLI